MIKRILILALFMVSVLEANCCWVPSYLPESYVMFRVLGDNLSGQMEYEKEISNQNCLKWKELTGEDIDLSDIYDLIYKTDTSSFATIVSDYSSNRFANWLFDNNETEILEYISLAKKYEAIRKEHNTAWYYPEDNETMTLDTIYEISVNYDGTVLSDRYTLQALKCLFATGKYIECLNLWKERKELFQEGDVLYKLAIGYVAGALNRTGQTDKAIEIYLQLGDIKSFYACLNKELPLVEKLNYIYNINPDSKEILSFIQSYIYSNSSRKEKGQDICYSATLDHHEDLKKIVKRVISDNRSKYMAEYKYTMAYLLDMEGSYSESLKYISSLKKHNSTKDLKDATRVLELWVRSEIQTSYTPAFEKYLFHELKWIDKIIASNLDSKSRNNIIKLGSYYIPDCYRLYYWNDMMRKIVLGKIVPLCISSRQETKALQYSNMADNRLFQLVPTTTINFSDLEISWDDYRTLKRHHNLYDYQTDYFKNLDTLKIKSVKDYADILNNPVTDLDKFLSERSYRDMEFLNDIIGTRLMSEMKFKEAIGYYRKVSKDFWESRNVSKFCLTDPITGEYYNDNQLPRLDFAKDMQEIEDKISKSKNRNDKAELMLTYAKALIKISSPKYWPMVSYSYSINETSKKYMTLFNAGIKIRDKAFTLFNDPERVAKAYYEWSMYKTVIDKYGETETASFIRGHCDKISDYTTKYKRNL